MKKFKGFFLLFVFALSMGFATSTEASLRSRMGKSGKSSRSNNKEKNDNLRNDGRTSGIGREMGSRIGGKIGDKLEKMGNKHAHDKWNNRDKNSTS